MSAFIITRIHVGDYDTWRPMFEQDRPLAREKAKVQRIFRDVDDRTTSSSSSSSSPRRTHEKHRVG